MQIIQYLLRNVDFEWFSFHQIFLTDITYVFDEISFHESRIVGEQLLEEGKISWEQFSYLMIGFEEKPRDMGDDL